MRAKIRLRQHWGESKKERLVKSSPKGKIQMRGMGEQGGSERKREEGGEGKRDRREERGREEEGGTSQCA